MKNGKNGSNGKDHKFAYINGVAHEIKSNHTSVLKFGKEKFSLSLTTLITISFISTEYFRSIIVYLTKSEMRRKFELEKDKKHD